jgi:KDO2-lipid IV(A) lauroyltransferase
MSPLREQIEYLLAKGYFSLLKYCPAPVIYGCCRSVAFLVYLAAPKRRRITMENLSIAFPEKPLTERRRIARTAYDHFGQMIAESAMILSGKLTKERLGKMVDKKDLARLLSLEESTEKGILVITGHLGNFELMGHYIGMHTKRQGCLVARKGGNRLIDDRIVTPMRESFGNRVIYKARALPQVSKALRDGKHVGILIDIKTNITQGTPITFFGKETLGLTSSAFLQIKLNVLVVPMAMIRTSPRRYQLKIGDPIEWKDNGAPREEQIAELTQIHQTALEQLIRKKPEQWLWMHNRWKLTS